MLCIANTHTAVYEGWIEMSLSALITSLDWTNSLTHVQAAGTCSLSHAEKQLLLIPQWEFTQINTVAISSMFCWCVFVSSPHPWWCLTVTLVQFLSLLCAVGWGSFPNAMYWVRLSVLNICCNFSFLAYLVPVILVESKASILSKNRWWMFSDIGVCLVASSPQLCR